MPWAIATGALYGWSGLNMPEPVSKTIALLSDAASPAALFAIGAILARNAVRATHISTPMDYVPIALAKLFAHPLAIFVAARAARGMGHAFTEPTLTALMLVAALPSASNVSTLAERFGVGSERIARIILPSTALSFFTFSGMVWLLGIQLPGDKCHRPVNSSGKRVQVPQRKSAWGASFVPTRLGVLRQQDTSAGESIRKLGYVQYVVLKAKTHPSV